MRLESLILCTVAVGLTYTSLFLVCFSTVQHTITGCGDWMNHYCKITFSLSSEKNLFHLWSNSQHLTVINWQFLIMNNQLKKKQFSKHHHQHQLLIYFLKDTACHNYVTSILTVKRLYQHIEISQNSFTHPLQHPSVSSIGSKLLSFLQKQNMAK